MVNLHSLDNYSFVEQQINFVDHIDYIDYIDYID